VKWVESEGLDSSYSAVSLVPYRSGQPLHDIGSVKSLPHQLGDEQRDAVLYKVWYHITELTPT
jgi:hypothetical protein